jgi:hypothetical protein
MVLKGFEGLAGPNTRIDTKLPVYGMEVQPN